MRITVGHILILAGVGGAAWMQFSSQGFDSQALLKKYSSATSQFNSLMGYFKSGAQPTPPLPSEPKVETPIDFPVVPEKRPETEATMVAPPAVPEKGLLVEAPVQKPVGKTRRSKRNRIKTAVDPLLGMMVSLTLTSGREVKGMLIERSATSYKIEMPGMGPFTYEASKVKSIKPSK